MEQRANVTFCLNLGKSATESFEMIQTAYGTEAMSRKSVFRWILRFRDGRDALEYDPRPVASKISRNEENVQRVAEVLASDRCISVQPIEELTGLPKTSVHRILTEDLQKRKLCARFVPHVLTSDQKRAGLEHCRDMQGQTVTAKYYVGVLSRLWCKILRKRLEYRKLGSWSLLHNNAPAHNAKAVRDFLAKKGVVVLDHPPYSPDLSPADFWLLPKLKLAMKGTRHDSIEDIQALRRVPQSYTEGRLQALLQAVSRAGPAAQ
ncbi:protein GVQW3-like [Ornithodoros turicata]|uniref:protein GVQW3-like n=1 Tax=Ornithodoros turicata TaxID=34597 RepID=UPI003139231B